MLSTKDEEIPTTNEDDKHNKSIKLPVSGRSREQKQPLTAAGTTTTALTATLKIMFNKYEQRRHVSYVRILKLSPFSAMPFMINHALRSRRSSVRGTFHQSGGEACSMLTRGDYSFFSIRHTIIQQPKAKLGDF